MQVGTAHIHFLRKFIGGEFDVVYVLLYNTHGTFQQLFVHGVESNFLRFHFQ